MKITIRLFALLSLSLSVGLMGCSGNSTSTSNPVQPLSTVNGYVGAANVRNATVYAVPVNVQGQPSTEINDLNQEVYLGSVSSSTTVGYYRADVKSQYIGGAMVFIAQAKDNNTTLRVCEVTDGCGAGWNYRQTKSVATGFRLLGAVGNIQNNTRVNVNWITHLAADHAYTSYIDESGNQGTSPETPLDGIFTPFTIERGNIWLSRQFGLSDVISVRPIAPSEMHVDQGLSSVLRQEGILYGLLLAGGQKLALDAGQTEAEWLRDVVTQQRQLQGQLYLNHATDFSLLRLYEAALDIAEKHQQLSSQAMPPQLNTVVDYLQNRVTQLAGQAEGAVSVITVDADEISNWVDRFANAKIFLKDTNERLLNYKGQDPDTCEVWNDDPARTCKNSFIDPAYVRKTTDYYDGLSALYKQVGPGFDKAIQNVRDFSLDFIRCLNGAACISTRYNATNKTYTVDGITLTLSNVELGLDGEDDDLFNAFDFLITGTQSVSYTNGAGSPATLSILYKQPKTTDSSGAEVIQKARLRVVYDDQYSYPPLTAVDDGAGQLAEDHVQPLGFDIEWPDVEVTLPDSQYLNLYFAAKLIGVQDVLDNDSLYHYNVTELSVSLLMRGAELGTITEDGKTIVLRNLSQMGLTAKPNNSANYYSETVWPELGDFFSIRDGFDVNVVQPDLFSYELQEDVQVVLKITDNVPQYVTADYFQVNIATLGIERFEVFSDTTGKLLRKCSVPLSGDNAARERGKVCSATQSVEADFDLLDDLIYGEEDYLGVFSIPGRGGYKPDFPEKNAFSSPATVDGTLVAVFAQGVDQLNLRAAHELVNGSGASVSRAPMAIVDMKLSRPSEDNWEVAIAAGYDYDYLVDVLPTGKRAQSIYLSYLVRELPGSEGERFFTELGGLIVFRGGVKLFTDEPAGESLGMTLASRVDYELDGNELPCGVANRDEEIREGDCNAVGYLTFRNSLVAVIREERAGVYVARFSDGTFLILGG